MMGPVDVVVIGYVHALENLARGPWEATTVMSFSLGEKQGARRAKAWVDGGTEFGYLYIISDNLGGKDTNDLSNARVAAVRGGRKRSLSEVSRFLDQ